MCFNELTFCKATYLIETNDSYTLFINQTITSEGEYYFLLDNCAGNDVVLFVS